MEKSARSRNNMNLSKLIHFLLILSFSFYLCCLPAVGCGGKVSLGRCHGTWQKGGRGWRQERGNTMLFKGTGTKNNHNEAARGKIERGWRLSNKNNYYLRFYCDQTISLRPRPPTAGCLKGLYLYTERRQTRREGGSSDCCVIWRGKGT
jgi:hypothetical protein